MTLCGGAVCVAGGGGAKILWAERAEILGYGRPHRRRSGASVCSGRRGGAAVELHKTAGVMALLVYMKTHFM